LVRAGRPRLARRRRPLRVRVLCLGVAGLGVAGLGILALLLGLLFARLGLGNGLAGGLGSLGELAVPLRPVAVEDLGTAEPVKDQQVLAG